MSVCKSVLGTRTHSLCICHSAYSCIVTYSEWRKQTIRPWLVVYFCVVLCFDKDDFLENSRILSCLAQLKSVLLNLLCAFDLLFFFRTLAVNCFRFFYSQASVFCCCWMFDEPLPARKEEEEEENMVKICWRTPILLLFRSKNSSEWFSSKLSQIISRQQQQQQFMGPTCSALHHLYSSQEKRAIPLLAFDQTSRFPKVQTLSEQRNFHYPRGSIDKILRSPKLCRENGLCRHN